MLPWVTLDKVTFCRHQKLLKTPKPQKMYALVNYVLTNLVWIPGRSNSISSCYFILFPLSLSTFDCVITLFDTLDCSCSSTVKTFEVLETGVWIFGHFSVDTLAIHTSYVCIDIQLVDSDYMLVLELSLEDEVSFATKVTFCIELWFVEVKNMLRFSWDLGADRLEVLPRCFSSRKELSHR